MHYRLIRVFVVFKIVTEWRFFYQILLLNTSLGRIYINFQFGQRFSGHLDACTTADHKLNLHRAFPEVKSNNLIFQHFAVWIRLDGFANATAAKMFLYKYLKEMTKVNESPKILKTTNITHTFWSQRILASSGWKTKGKKLRAGEKERKRAGVLMLELKVLQLVGKVYDVVTSILPSYDRIYLRFFLSLSFIQKCTLQICLIKYCCSKIYTSTPSSGPRRVKIKSENESKRKR